MIMMMIVIMVHGQGAHWINVYVLIVHGHDACEIHVVHGNKWRHARVHEASRLVCHQGRHGFMRCT